MPTRAEFFPDPTILRRAFPRRGGGQIGKIPAASTAELSAKIPGFEQRFWAALVEKPMKKPAPGSVEDDAFMLAYVAGDRSGPAAAVDYLISARGLGHAVDAVIAAADLKFTGRGYQTDLKLEYHPDGLGALLRLRQRLAWADEASYEAARKVAEGRWAKARNSQAAAISFLFPACPGMAKDALELRWSAEAVKRLKQQPECGIMALGGVADAEVLGQLGDDVHYNMALDMGAGANLAAHLADVLGAHAAPFFAKVDLTSFRELHRGSELEARLAAIMGMFGHDGVFWQLIAAADKKPAQAALARAMLHQPERAQRLLGEAVAKKGKIADAAKTLLVQLGRHQPATGSTAGKAAGPREGEAPAAVVPKVLRQADAKPVRLPEYLVPGSLPAPEIAGKGRLPVTAVERLLAILEASTLETPHADLASVKKDCTPSSMAAFVWEALEAWVVAGGPGKGMWILRAVAHLGDDDCARRLAAMIRVWPGEAAHARAVVGLDVLGKLGTDVALMHLNAIAQRVKFKGLQERARERIAELAEARGLSPEELADRLVPDLGLDADGTMVFDFGPRRFRARFDEVLRPFVTDERGQRLSDLPPAGKQDDKGKASEAAAAWKALKKDARTIASLELFRLEQTMCSRRRIDAPVFRQVFVAHPLVGHLVRRLVWGVYDAKGRLTATFRVAEDRTFADVEDRAFKLADGARVGVPHALELGRAAERWSQVFADHELAQPFAQLGRAVHEPSPAERKARALARFSGHEVPTGKVLGLLARGWRKGPPQDAGGILWLEKAIDGGRTLELALEPGLQPGMPGEHPRQTLGEVRLEGKGKPPLGSLDPIAFSELVLDVQHALA
jgi:hypothetical protein